MRWFAVRALILVIFFISTLTLSVGTPFFNSPDENATFVFAKQFARGQTFEVKDEINVELNGIIHPRSTIALGEYIIPISFLGLPFLSGIIGSVLGPSTMLLITPILAVLALLAWRSSMLRFYCGDSVTDAVTESPQQIHFADLSALFLMVHPAFWYYSARTMMHNVGFVSLLILAFWFAFVRPLKKQWLNWVGSGTLLGFVIGFRTSE